MPQYAKNLDVYQGYNYKKDKQTPVGYITSIKIGDQTLTADQTCKDPKNPTSDLKVVAVLNNFLWQTGVTDAVYFSGQISTSNKQNVALLVLTNMTKVDVVFQFCVYDYDPLQKQYFEGCWSNSTDMNGILEKSGDDLNLSVVDDPSHEVQSPENYTFMIGIKPQPSAQNLNIATSVSNKVVKSWGLAVG